MQQGGEGLIDQEAENYAGLTASYLLSTPVGASVVVVNLMVFLCFCALRAVRSR